MRYTCIDIYWTRAIDSVFMENEVKMKNVGYQHLSTPSGVMRIYPATGEYTFVV